MHLLCDFLNKYMLNDFQRNKFCNSYEQINHGNNVTVKFVLSSKTTLLLLITKIETLTRKRCNQKYLGSFYGLSDNTVQMP